MRTFHFLGVQHGASVSIRHLLIHFGFSGKANETRYRIIAMPMNKATEKFPFWLSYRAWHARLR